MRGLTPSKGICPILSESISKVLGELPNGYENGLEYRYAPQAESALLELSPPVAVMPGGPTETQLTSENVSSAVEVLRRRTVKRFFMTVYAALWESPISCVLLTLRRHLLLGGLILLVVLIRPTLSGHSTKTRTNPSTSKRIIFIDDCARARAD